MGRVGRIEYNLYGNVFLMRLPEKQGHTRKMHDRKKLEKLLTGEVPPQELAVVQALSDNQKKHIVNCLADGNISLVDPKIKTPDNYELMRNFAQILLKDILGGKNSFVVRSFANFLDDAKVQAIKGHFEKKSDIIDDDINTSVDQTESLRDAIVDKINPLRYPLFSPDGTDDYNKRFYHNELMPFLIRIADIFKWDKYEKMTLGVRNKRTGQYSSIYWYGNILLQWMQSYGVAQIIDGSLWHKKTYNGVIYRYNQMYYYDASSEHKNMVISETLEAIERVILFSLSNYFSRISSEYKKHHKLSSFKNDWYEFVEYGTTKEIVIYFQRNGFSREVALWINKSNYVVDRHSNAPKLKMSIKDCNNANVRKEVKDMLFNAGDLFVDDPV